MNHALLLEKSGTRLRRIFLKAFTKLAVTETETMVESKRKYVIHGKVLQNMLATLSARKYVISDKRGKISPAQSAGNASARKYLQRLNGKTQRHLRFS